MSAMPETFTTTIVQEGKTATGLPVPAEVVEALNEGKRPKVLVTVAGHTYRSSIAAYRGEFMLPLSAENREAAGVHAGETVEVTVALDREERRVALPDDLAAAFEQHPEARTAFDALSYSKQRQRAEAVAAAKQAETRQRRIAQIIAELTAG